MRNDTTDNTTTLPSMLGMLFEQATFKQALSSDLCDKDSLYNKCIRGLRQLSCDELSDEIVFTVIQLIKAGVGNPRLGEALTQGNDLSIDPAKKAKAVEIATRLRPPSGW